MTGAFYCHEIWHWLMKMYNSAVWCWFQIYISLSKVIYRLITPDIVSYAVLIQRKQKTVSLHWMNLMD